MRPKIFVSDLDYGEEEISAVVSVIRSEWMTMGPITKLFEEQFSRYVSYPFAIATSSGTAALHLSLMEADIDIGDEVITTPISFVASTNCILYERAVPVFADIDPKTWNINPERIRDQISSKTKAMIIVHFAGLPAKMDEICEICDEHNLILIEDAAHAIGTYYKGNHVGGFGDFGCFSFFSNKNLSTGEGGMIVVKDARRRENLHVRRSHGLDKPTWNRHISGVQEEDRLYDMNLLGYNYRMGEIQAAIGLEQLKRIEGMNAQRLHIYDYYIKRIREEELDDFIQVQEIPKNVTHSHHIFPVLLKKRNRKKVREFLHKRNIGTSIHYTPIPSFSYYKKLGYDITKYPVADDHGKRTVTLPLHQKLTENDVDYIITALKDFFKN